MLKPPHAPGRAAVGSRRWTGALIAVAATAVAVAGGMPQQAAVTAAQAQAQAAPATLTEARAKGQASAEIQGFVDIIARNGAGVALQGWAADTSAPETPVTVMAFAGETLLGSAPVSDARADVAAYLKVAESSLVAYGIATDAACPAGQPITVLAVAEDQRFAELPPSGTLKLACP